MLASPSSSHPGTITYASLPHTHTTATTSISPVIIDSYISLESFRMWCGCPSSRQISWALLPSQVSLLQVLVEAFSFSSRALPSTSKQTPICGIFMFASQLDHKLQKSWNVLASLITAFQATATEPGTEQELNKWWMDCWLVCWWVGEGQGLGYQAGSWLAGWVGSWVDEWMGKWAERGEWARRLGRWVDKSLTRWESGSTPTAVHQFRPLFDQSYLMASHLVPATVSLYGFLIHKSHHITPIRKTASITYSIRLKSNHF